jgi:hypothetical protein
MMTARSENVSAARTKTLRRRLEKMPRFLCHISRFGTPLSCNVANVLMSLHCTQGVPSAPYRVGCSVFVREPGANDEWPVVRPRGVMPTRYAVIAAT